ncbi:MAG: autotransporter-associated beta strand repeat-containing protein, partial [Pirellulaceae bacterium]|nr:autotransporter-associated beta strand repeat-containing protein [Pirellulaceae bacterium]
MSYQDFPATSHAKKRLSRERGRRAGGRHRSRRLTVEALEDRRLLATWIGGSSGNWNVAANWSPANVPDGDVPGETAVFNTASTVTLDVDLAAAANPIAVQFDTGSAVTIPATTNGINVSTVTQDAGTNSIGAVLSGATGSVVVNAGNLTLTAANTYGGGTTVSAGSANVTATVNTTQNSVGTGAVSIDSGSTLQLNNTNTSSTAVTIGNTFTGAGLLKLNFAAGTTARSTTMNNVTGFAGTIQLSNAGVTGDKWNVAGITAGSAAVQIDSGSQLFINTGASTFGSVAVTGTGNSENRGAIRLANTLNGSISLLGNTTIGTEGGILSGNISSGAAGTQTLTLGTSNSTGNATLSGNIGGGTGTLALTKAQAGTTTLSGTNSYDGGTTINAGAIVFNSPAAIAGTGRTVTVNAGGVASAGYAIDQAFVDRIVQSSAGAVGLHVASANNVSLAGFPSASLGATAAVTYSGTLTPDSSAYRLGGGTAAGSLTISPVLGDSGGPTSLTKVGTDTVVLGAAETYTGSTAVNAGTLQVSTGGSITGTSALAIDAGTFQIVNGASVAVTGGVTNGTGAGSLFMDEGTMTIGNGLDVDTLRVGNMDANSGTSNLTVSGGTVVIGSGTQNMDLAVRSNSLGSSQSAHNATLDLASADSVTINVASLRIGNIIGNPSNEGGVAGNLYLSTAGANAITATSVIVGNSSDRSNAFMSTIRLGGGTNTINASTLTLGGLKGRGQITNPANGSLQIEGKTPGSKANVDLSVSANGTGVIGSGALDMNAGTLDALINTLRLGSQDTGSGSATGTLTFAAGTVSATTVTLGTGTKGIGTINQNGGTFKIGTLSKGTGTATFNWNSGTIQNNPGANLSDTNVPINVLTAGTHTIAVDGGQTATFAAAAALSGAGSLTKAGAGALILNGTNSYNGTSVSSGTLSGVGTLAGATTVAPSGAIDPGTVGGIGTLNVGATTFSSGSAFAPQITGLGSVDLLNSSGTVDLGGASLQPGLVGYTGTTGNAFVVLQGTSVTGTFAGLPTSGVSQIYTGGRAFTVTYNPTDVTLTDNGPFATPAEVYTDPSWSALNNGDAITDADPVTAGDQGAIFGQNAFASVNAAVAGVSSSGTIFVNSGAYPENVNLTGSLTLKLLGTDASTPGTIAFGSLTGASGTVIDTSSIGSLSNTLEVGSLDNSSTFAGIISGLGGLTKTGTGTLLLSNVHVYGGATTIRNGTIALAGGNDRLPVGTVVTLGDGSTNDSGKLQLSDGTTARNQALAGLLTAGTGTNNRVVGGGTTNATLTLNIASGTNSYAGILGGPGSGDNNLILIKTGAGTLSLSGTNTFTGGATINGGTIVAANTAALGPAGNVITISTGTNSGTLDLATDSTVNAWAINTSSNNPGTIVSNRATPGPGITHVLGAAALGNNTYSFTQGANVTSGTAGISLASVNLSAGGTGTMTLNPTTATLTVPGAVNIGSNNFAKTLRLDGASSGNSISGIISNGLNTLTLTKSNTSTWTLSGANTYTGTTTVSAGTLQLGATNALPVTTALTVGSGTTVGTFDLAGFDQTVGSLSSTANNAAASLITVAGGNTLTVNGNVTLANNTDAGQTNLTIDGGGALVVNGTNILVGNNTGGTNISSKANLDLTALSTFTAVLTGSLIVQASGDNSAADPASLKLSDTANTITAANLYVGNSGTGATNTFTLGAGTNIINVDAVHLGRGTRDTGVINFAGPGGSVTLRNAAGTGRANVTLGITSSQGTAYTTANLFDVSGHTADLAIDTLATSLGAKTASNTNDLRFDSGTLDIKSINMAVAKGTGSSINKISLGGGTVRLGGSAEFGDLGTGTVTLATAGSGELAITGGVVTSSVDFTRASGTGTAILTLNGGTLDMAGKNIGGATAINTLNFQSGTLQNVAQINNGAGLTKTTAGTLVVRGVNTYTGTTTISAGTLQIADGDDRLPTGTTVNFNGSGTLDVGGNAQTIAALTLTGTGLTGTVTGDGSLTVNGASDFRIGSTTAAQTQTLDMSGLGTFVYNSPTKVFSVGAQNTSGNSGSATVTLAANNSITALRFGVADVSTSDTGANAGTLHLGQVNTIHADDVRVGYNKTIGTMDFQSGLTNPSLTIRATDGSSRSATMTVGLNNSGVSAGTGTVDLTTGVSGTSTLNALVGTVTIGQIARGSSGAKNSTGNFKMGGGALDATTILLGSDTSGSSGATAAGTLSVDGGAVKAGTLTLGNRAGGDTVTGTFTLTNGTLAAQTVQHGVGTATRTFTWTNGTIQNYDAATDLSVSSGLTLTMDPAGTHTFSIDSERNGTVSAVLAQSAAAAALTKLGAGTLTLSTTNTYGGGTIVNDGILKFSADGQLGTAGVGVTLGGGTLQYTGGTLGFSRPITLTADSSISNTGGAPLTLTGKISDGAGTAGWTHLAGSIYVNNPTNDYDGPTIVKSGAGLYVASNNALGTASGATTVESGGILNVETNYTTLETLYLNGGILRTSSEGSTVYWSGPVILGADSSIRAKNQTSAATLVVNGDITGNYSLSINQGEPGKVVFGGTNSYSGTTTVYSGTLLVNGSTTSNTTVNSGGVLGGNGTITGNVTSIGTGVVNPGNSPGTLIVNGNYSASTVFEVNTPYATAGTDYDQVIVNPPGTLVDLSSATIAFAGTGGGSFPALPSLVTLIANNTASATVASPSFANGATVTLVGGVQARIFYNGGDGNDVVLVSAAAPTTIYIDDSFTQNPGQFILDADQGTTGDQNAIFGVNAFASIATAQTAYPGFGGAFIVNGGSYSATTLASTQAITVTGVDAAQTAIFAALTTASGQNITIQGSSNLTVGDANSTTIAGVISGSGSLTKQGAGTVTLTSGNTFTGGVTLSAGTLDIQNNSALGTGTFTIAGGTIQTTSGARQLGNAVVISGDFSVGSTNNITLANGGTNGISLNAGTRTVTVTNGSMNLFFDGEVSNGGLIKNGSGRLALNRVNTFTGGATVNAGTLSFGSNSGAGSGTLTINGGNVQADGAARTLANAVSVGGDFSITGSQSLVLNGALDLGGATRAATVSATNAATFGGVVFNGGLTKAGTGTLNLAGNAANTYSGLTTVNAGTLALSKTGGVVAVPGNLQVSGGNVTFPNSGAQNQIANTSEVTVSSGVFNGTAVNSGHQSTITETIGSLSLTGGAFNAGTSGNWTITGAGSFTGGVNTIFLGNSGAQLSFGSLSLTNMTATAGGTVATNNSFTLYGNSTGTQSRITVGSGGLALNNSVLNLRRGGAGAQGSRLVLDGDVTTSGTAATFITEDTAGGTTGSIAVQLSSTPGTHTRTVTTAGGGADLTVGVPITNGAATTGNLVKDDGGTLILTGASTYNGATAIQNGTLQLGSGANRLPVGTVVTLGSGANSGVLALNGNSQQIAGLTTSGTGTDNRVRNGSSTAATLIVTNTSDFTFAGVLGGSTPNDNNFALTKDGGAKLTLTGNNTYTGTTAVNMGVLNTQHGNALGATAGTTSVAGGAVLELQGGITVGEALNTLAGTLRSVSGNNTWTGAITLASTIDVAAGSTLDVTGQISGAGLTKTGGGTLILSNTGNNYSGNTDVQGGQLRLGASEVIPNGSTVTLAGSTTLDLNSYSETIHALSGSGTVTSGAAGSPTLTINNGNGQTFSGAIQNGSGTVALTKAGAGTQTLSGANTYTGATTIDGGTLLVNGSTAAGSAVGVNSTGTLGGTGTIGGAVTVNGGGTVAPGTDGTVATLTVGSLAFNGGTFKVDIASDSSDRIVTAGAIDLAAATQGVFAFGTVGGTTSDGTVFTLIDNTHASNPIVDPPLSGATEGGSTTVNSKTAVFTYAGGSGGNDLTLTVASDWIFNGTASADEFELRRATVGMVDNLQLLIGGSVVESRPMASVNSVTINGLDGNDTLTVNYGHSGGVFNKAVTFHGGDPTTAPGDKLIVTGGSFATGTFVYTGVDSGTIQLTGAGLITYTGLEPIDTTGSTIDDLEFTLPAGPSTATLANDGGNLKLSASAFEDTTFANPSGSVTIHRGNAADTLTIGPAISNLTATLTIGTGGAPLSELTFSGAITFAANKSLTGYASGTISLSSGTSDIATSGTGSVSLITARNITLASGSSLTTVNGGITLEANQQMTPTAGNFIGFAANNAVIQTTGIGNILLKGRGGDDAGTSNHYGVNFHSGTSVSSTASGATAGTITIEGTGGSGTNSNDGVALGDSTTKVTSVDGDISITGVGNGSGGANVGVTLYNIDTIASTGTGANAAKITIHGTGGNGTSSNRGVYLSGSTTDVTSEAGDIMITGVGGGGGAGIANYGVYLDGIEKISSTGMGADAAMISIHGTGGSASDQDHGVFVTGSSTQIASLDGAIDITGIGQGLGPNTHGVYIFSGITLAINATGSATIDITGNGAGAAPGVQVVSPISSGTGAVTIESVDDDIVFGAAGDVTSTSGTVSVTADTAMGNNGGAIGMADGAVIDAGSGMIALSADGNVTLGRLVTTNASTTAVTISSTSGGVVDGGDTDGVDVQAPSGRLVVTAATGIDLDTTVASIMAAVTDSGDISIFEQDAVTLTGVTTYDGDIEIYALFGPMTATSVIAGGVGDVLLTTTPAPSPVNHIHVVEVTAIGDRVTLAAGGNITQTGGAVTITALEADLRAVANVGSSVVPIVTQASYLEGVAGTGSFFLKNSGDLIIGGIIADNDPFGVSASGDIVITALSALDVAEDVVSTGGVVLLTAADSAGGGDDLTVRSGVLVRSHTSTVELRAGDDMTLEDCSTVRAATTITLRGDYDDVDGSGSVMDLLGTLDAADGNYNVLVYGGPNGDVITLNPGGSHSADSTLLDGGAGDDQYFIHTIRLNGVPTVNGAHDNAVLIADTSGNDRATVFATDAAEDIYVLNNVDDQTAAQTGG